MPAEPHITINGITLTSAQACTVRVALTDFMMSINNKVTYIELGEVGPLYKARLMEIFKIMFEE